MAIQVNNLTGTLGLDDFLLVLRSFAVDGGTSK